MLFECLHVYSQACTTQINWSKCKAVWVGCTPPSGIPTLAMSLSWVKEGVEYLGVYLGSPGFVKRNWDSLLHKMSNKLNTWIGILSTLSFRGCALVIYNLVAPLLWHKMIVLQPPVTLVSLIQKCLLDFFWPYSHTAVRTHVPFPARTWLLPPAVPLSHTACREARTPAHP